MKVLVTGGCGFIGSHLVDRLIAEGHEVAVLDNLSSGKRENLNPKAILIEHDVSHPYAAQQLVPQVDVVFHLAAIASVQVCENEPEKAQATNVNGTLNIFSFAAKHNKPVIYASSAAVYGDNPQLPLTEQSATGPLGNYGKHKLLNEVAARQMHEQFGLKSVGLRFFNVYGPRQDAASPYSGVISKFMANARTNQPLTFFGDGTQTRDFIYVGDLVNLLMQAWQNATGCLVLNGCTGKATNLTQLAFAIINTTDSKSITQHAEPRAGDIRHSLGSPDQALAMLGFTARTTLEHGLKALFESEARHVA